MSLNRARNVAMAGAYRWPAGWRTVCTACEKGCGGSESGERHAHCESLSRSAERRSKSLWRGEALGEAQNAMFAVIARVADELSTKAFGSRAQHTFLQFLQFVA